jgi:hypothetical protein
MAVFLMLASGGWLAAQSDSESGSADGSPSPAMAPGNIDVGIGGGLGGLIYPHLEPQVDVGVLNTESITLSAGGLVDAGYCVFCGILGAIADDWKIRSWYVGAYGRALVHLNSLGAQLGDGARLDPFVGVHAGPQLYRFRLVYEPDDTSSSYTETTVGIVPTLGARLFFNEEIRWFGFGEMRYLIEFGFQDSTVNINGEPYTVDETVSRRGFDLTLGIGTRL